MAFTGEEYRLPSFSPLEITRLYAGTAVCAGQLALCYGADFSLDVATHGLELRRRNTFVRMEVPRGVQDGQGPASGFALETLGGGLGVLGCRTAGIDTARLEAERSAA